ncbi:MAG: hypothetical protein IJA84_01070, partial [Clostridia bacterium]|nr:hypothetical protein [Clostridia bacterium]
MQLDENRKIVAVQISVYRSDFGCTTMVNVGAIIDRPRSTFLRIRRNECEIVTFSCRAVDNRPYIENQNTQR